jgi:hypothetical protein
VLAIRQIQWLQISRHQSEKFKRRRTSVTRLSRADIANRYLPYMSKLQTN